jgi:hypothetical protein
MKENIPRFHYCIQPWYQSVINFYDTIQILIITVTLNYTVKNSLRSDYPPPEDVALPRFLLRTANFFNRTCLSGKAQPGYYHTLRTWVFELN